MQVKNVKSSRTIYLHKFRRAFVVSNKYEEAFLRLFDFDYRVTAVERESASALFDLPQVDSSYAEWEINLSGKEIICICVRNLEHLLKISTRDKWIKKAEELLDSKPIYVVLYDKIKPQNLVQAHSISQYYNVEIDPGVEKNILKILEDQGRVKWSTMLDLLIRRGHEIGHVRSTLLHMLARYRLASTTADNVMDWQIDLEAISTAI